MTAFPLRRACAAALGWWWLLTGPASALVDVRIGTCTIIVSAPGVLTASADLKTLSTVNPGGSPGRVQISTLINGSFPHATCSLVVQLNCFRVSVVQPSHFSVYPTTGNDAVAFTGIWRPQGGSSLLDVLSAIILNGNQSLDLHLTATKTSGTFAAGTYRAEQTVRCE
ncbi:hypothetical protein [Aureimonas pseudogalii]|uniref:Spore coat protein U domain-containing protein n=1 Tax=Aureimonas pseudogalii TaxID=1744844 RepID=A0A7W6H5C9_9HYPH|nr:hypothetical protein [Aureimonas pseudogalii]MBB3998859.1 hypothetical protein [Aureimonas pseudogalii]